MKLATALPKTPSSTAGATRSSRLLPAAMAAALAGPAAQALEAITESMSSMPLAELRRQDLRWHYRQPEVIERLMEGLRRAGVDIGDTGER